MALKFRNMTSTLKKLIKIPLLRDSEKLNMTILQEHILVYSTIVSKQRTNMFEIVTDLLLFSLNFGAGSAECNRLIPSGKLNIQTETHKIGIIDRIDLSNYQTSTKVLIDELYESIKAKNWTCASKILQFFIDKNVCISQALLLSFAEEFRQNGFKGGIKQLLILADILEADHLTKGQLMHNLIRCTWMIGNVSECLYMLVECHDKHSHLANETKKLARIMINQAVRNRSEAVLITVTKFVETFTEKYDDYYLLTMLWYDLFLSEWYSDQQLAAELFDKFENMKVCIRMLCPFLSRHLLKQANIRDLHRLLEFLLKKKMIQSYRTVTQIMFDHYLAKKDKYRCSEIVKSSYIVGAHLRDEQYSQFISWSVSGNPYKFLNTAHIEKVYSKC